MANMQTRLLSLFLCLALLFSLMPMNIFAENITLYSDNSDTVIGGSNEDTVNDDTESDTILIGTASELIEFRDDVNGGNDYSGKTVKLSASIALTEEWTPIGVGARSNNSYTGCAFKGTFDGNNFEISNLTITSTDGKDHALGLFGIVDGGLVKNLKLVDVSISVPSSELAGGAIGILTGNGVADNITVSGEVNAKRGNGGIVGRMLVSGTISNCTNNATISATGANAGGIVGAAYYTAVGEDMYISSCTNNGVITSTAGVVGGIVGLSSAHVANCTNTSVITGAGDSIGGIVGEQQNYGSITKCANTANVTTATGYAAGGIVGWIRYNGADESYPLKGVVSVTDSSNSGSVFGGNVAGGIVGTVYHAANVNGNSNTASALEAATFAAGIVGNFQFTDTYWGGSIPEKTLNCSNNISTTAIENIKAVCTNLFVYDNSSGTQDGVISNNKSVAPYGTLTKAYTVVNGYSGECGGNASESFMFKFYCGDTFMGYTSLNNIDGIIDGDVYVTWNIKLDAASNTDEYWTMAWEIAPSITMMPNRVEQWVDGVKVAECEITPSYADDKNPIIAANADSEGKILNYIACEGFNTSTAGDAIKNALSSADEGNIIQFFAGELELGTVKFPATLKDVTVKGADNKATIIKNSTLMSSDGSAVHYEGITFEGIVFDNSTIWFTGARSGEVIYKDWTITSCEFKNIVSSSSAIHFNLQADEAFENLTFTNNVIDGVSGGNVSGLRVNYLIGNVTISSNKIMNVAWNALQLINSQVDSFIIENNVFASSASEGIVNLYGVTATNVTIKSNQFLVMEEQPGICYASSMDVSDNYWGGTAPSNLPDGVTYDSYYTVVSEDGSLGGRVLTHPAVYAYDANGTMVDMYADFESALIAAMNNADIIRIEILTDINQTTIANLGQTYKINGSLTIGAPKGESYTVTLPRDAGKSFSIYLYNGNTSLTIEENVNIEGLDILANGFATSTNSLVIKGGIKAMSLKVWTSDEGIVVEEGGRVWLGYGDGQLDLAYGNGYLTINGVIVDTSAEGLEPQFKAGYSGTRGNGNIITLNNTYFEAGSKFTMNGTNGVININNSLFKVSGGDYPGSFTIASGNVIYVNSGSILDCANITINEGAKIVVNGGKLIATGITNNGTIEINGGELIADTVTNNSAINVTKETILNITTATGETIDFYDGAVINNSTVGGSVYVLGNVTFRGKNTFAMLYDFGAAYSDPGAHWRVEVGASVTLTDTARYGLGYGDKVTIYGSITDALAARDNLTEDDLSLFLHGISMMDNWDEDNYLTVENAYVVIGSNNSFGTKDSYGKKGKYYITFNNSVLDSSRVTVVSGGGVTYFAFTDSDIKLGAWHFNQADSIANFTGSYMLVTGNGTDYNNANAGNMSLVGSIILFESGAFTNSGTITLDVNSSLTTPSLIGAGKIVIDVSGYTGGIVQIITADMSSFTGNIELVGNDEVMYEITAEGVVVYKPVASVTDANGNITYHPTLEDAFAIGNGTVTLLENITLTSTLVVNESDNITLNLAGKALTIVDPTTNYAINNRGTLLIKDTIGSGSVTARGIYNGNDSDGNYITTATITVEGGSFFAVGTNGGAAIFNYGVAIINGGTFEGYVALNNRTGASMTINNAIINGGNAYAVQNNGGALTINNATVYGDFGAIGQWIDSSVTIIKDGIFVAIGNEDETSHAVYVSAGKLTIEGGTFEAKEIYNGFALNIAGSSTVTITGGNFIGHEVESEKYGAALNDCIYLNSESTGSVTITNGTFTHGISKASSSKATATVSGGVFGSNVSIYLSDDLLLARNNESGQYTVIENTFFTFKGACIRYLLADGSTNSTSYADIRFSYVFNEDFEFVEGSWGWNYKLGATKTGEKAGSYYTSDNRTNLVFTNVQFVNFDKEIASQLWFVATIDGVKYTIYDNYQIRTTIEVVNGTADYTGEGYEDAVAYATELRDNYNAYLDSKEN